MGMSGSRDGVPGKRKGGIYTMVRIPPYPGWYIYQVSLLPSMPRRLYVLHVSLTPREKRRLYVLHVSLTPWERGLYVLHVSPLTPWENREQYAQHDLHTKGQP